MKEGQKVLMATCTRSDVKDYVGLKGRATYYNTYQGNKERATVPGTIFFAPANGKAPILTYFTNLVEL